MMKLTLVAIALLATTAFASDVVELTDGDWKASLSKNKDVLLEVYAPWCGHCKKLIPVYDELATKVKGDNIVVAKIDGTQHKTAMAETGTRGFPSLYYYKNGKLIDKYAGPRDLDGLSSYVKKQKAVADGDVAALAEKAAAAIKEPPAQKPKEKPSAGGAGEMSIKGPVKVSLDGSIMKDVTLGTMISTFGTVFTAGLVLGALFGGCIVSNIVGAAKSGDKVKKN